MPVLATGAQDFRFHHFLIWMMSASTLAGHCRVVGPSLLRSSAFKTATEFWNGALLPLEKSFRILHDCSCCCRGAQNDEKGLGAVCAQKLIARFATWLTFQKQSHRSSAMFLWERNWRWTINGMESLSCLTLSENTNQIVLCLVTAHWAIIFQLEIKRSLFEHFPIYLFVSQKFPWAPYNNLIWENASKPKIKGQAFWKLEPKWLHWIDDFGPVCSYCCASSTCNKDISKPEREIFFSAP